MSPGLQSVLLAEVVALATWLLFIAWWRAMVIAAPSMRRDNRAAELRHLRMKQALIEIVGTAVTAELLIAESRRRTHVRQ